ncbi:MAG: undecaprenyl-diphosphate phosphatase [Clostridia bacterium]|nr:undecaprenyl-diphosphate phosphatase [Clostridia bacterium]
MDFLNSIIQGIIQGLTEFLPVSSSGHLALYQYYTTGNGMGADNADPLLSIVLHLGTLVAVFFAFRKRIWALILEFFATIKDIFTGKFSFKTMNKNRRMLVMLVVACVPLLAILLVKDAVENVANYPLGLACCFLVTACLLFFAHKKSKREDGSDEVKLKNGIAVGIAQAIATLPGISRSGSTTSAGLFTGLDKQTAIEFSFILGIPAILGAAVLEIKDTVEAGATDVNVLALIVGMAVSAVVGYLAIKGLEYILKKNKFSVFAIYTLALGVLVFAEGIYELAAGQTIFQAIGLV